MARPQHPDARTAGGRSLVSRIVGVGGRRATYANLVYLLARFPLGVAYFSVFLTGLTLGVGLLPVGIGLPILAGVVGLAGYVGVVEAALLHRLYGQDISYTAANPGELSITTYLKTVVTTPRNYLLMAFAFGSFVVGLPLFVVLTVVFTLAAALVAAPLLFWIPGVEYDLTYATGTIDLGLVTIDAGSVAGVGITTLPEAVVASALGAVLGVVGLHAVNLIAGTLRTLIARVLGVRSE